jgi:uncharacterized protein (DUF427 family)
VVDRSERIDTEVSVMRQAIWNGVILAESDATVVIDGKHYFPSSAVRRQYLRPSSHHTVCPWKGVASYYDVVVGDRINRDAAWYYASPKPAARGIHGYVAFWRGVRVAKAASASADVGSAPVPRRSWLRRLVAR